MLMREKYSMKPNKCSDCLTAFYCHYGELIQEDKETIICNTGKDPKTGQQYIAPQDMTYP